MQALYWAVITGTTVGFGDLTPDSDGDGAIIFLLFYIPTVSMTFVMKVVGALHVNASNHQIDCSKASHRGADGCAIW